MLELTFPNGQEVLLRGQSYFIRWNDNIAEDVVIELYKCGVFLKSIATNSSVGAYKWEIGFDTAPSHDYVVKVRSSINDALYDVSDAAFSIIDLPLLTAESVRVSLDGMVQIALDVPGAAQATVLCSTNLCTWEQLGVVSLINGAAIFTDVMATNLPWRFYRVRVP